jgi:hypothetical protein
MTYRKMEKIWEILMLTICSADTATDWSRDAKYIVFMDLPW